MQNNSSLRFLEERNCTGEMERLSPFFCGLAPKKGGKEESQNSE